MYNNISRGTIYEGRKLYPIHFLEIRHGLPCNCMCSEVRTRKKLSRLRVAILKANHFDKSQLIASLGSPSQNI